MQQVTDRESPAQAAGPSADHPVIIIGGGFAGLACAKELGRANVPTILIDAQNYHLFVPLLYQVATAALSPADIAQPIRRILRRHPRTQVRMATVEGIDAAARAVVLAGGERVSYSRLVIATGSICNYFGHDEWASHAPCPRSLGDATGIRARLLSALERAEHSRDPQERRKLLTFVIIGGGPTGVEMAGAVAELVSGMLGREFRALDPADARILLVEAGPRLLTAFPEPLADYAAGKLEKLGVMVMTERRVAAIEEGAVVLDGETIAAETIIWGAGTRAAPSATWLGLTGDRAGRIPVDRNLAVQGMAGVYALGDVALCHDADGKPLPALAQVAKQQGEHLGKELAKALQSRAPIEAALPPFTFQNRGNTAIIGRNAAIFDFGGGRTLRGRLAWLLWAIVHVYLLVGLERRFLVVTQWVVRYVTRQRGARLITNEAFRQQAPSADAVLRRQR